MKNAIAPRGRSEVAPVFRWRDRFGAFHSINKMETRHLFHVIRMIWNQTMPAEARTHRFHRYEFSPFYTDLYFAKAIEAGIPELLRRELTAAQRQTLESMAAYLARRRARIAAPVLELTREAA